MTLVECIFVSEKNRIQIQRAKPRLFCASEHHAVFIIEQCTVVIVE